MSDIPEDVLDTARAILATIAKKLTDAEVPSMAKLDPRECEIPRLARSGVRAFAMKRETIPEINLAAYPEERFGEIFTEADEREAEEILAKPEDEKQKIIDARVAVLLEKIAQKSGNKLQSS